MNLDISEINWQNLSARRRTRGSQDYNMTERLLLENLKTQSLEKINFNVEDLKATAEKGKLPREFAKEAEDIKINEY